MGHTKAENEEAIEQIKKLNEDNPLKEYDVDSFVQGMRYGKEESKKIVSVILEEVVNFMKKLAKELK